jgi:putative phage-type endonuclease
MDDVATDIIECAQCRRELRIPARRTALEVTCPTCRSKFTSFPYTTVDFTQGTQAWLDWRNQGIGASDAPAIMGENPWKSPDRLLKEKLNRVSSELNKAMRRGTVLEPEARSRYEELTGIKVRPICLESTQFYWFRASLDGLAHDGSSVIEIKCGEAVYRHAASEHEVPRYYVGQLQHILAVTGLARIDFWCYLPGRPEVHLCIDRDDHYIDRLIETESRFWQKLESKR